MPSILLRVRRRRCSHLTLSFFEIVTSALHDRLTTMERRALPSCLGGFHACRCGRLDAVARVCSEAPVDEPRPLAAHIREERALLAACPASRLRLSMQVIDPPSTRWTRIGESQQPPPSKRNIDGSGIRTASASTKEDPPPDARPGGEWRKRVPCM